MKRFTFIPALLLGALLLTGLAPKVPAQDPLEDPDIVVTVDGLACPFCAYGLEKKLKNLGGVSEVSVLLDEGETRLKLEKEATVSAEKITAAVENAGFTATHITYVNQAARPSSEQPESG